MYTWQPGMTWLLRHPPDTLLISGTISVEHFEQDMAAASVEFDAETMADLDAIAAATSGSQPPRP